MAKQKKQQIVLTAEELFTQSRAWARTPIGADSDISLGTTQDIVRSILGRLQSFWNMQKATENRGDRQLYMRFQSEDFEVKQKKESGYNEGDVVFRLRLSDIESPNHYDRARAALSMIPCTYVLVPDKENPGYYRTQSFADIRGRTEEDPVTKERYFVGTEFEVIIPRLTAENILDISLTKGYIRLMAYPMKALRSPKSRTIYGILSEKWNMGHGGNVFVIPMTEIRAQLGFVKTKTDDRSKMYESWSKFCEKVLEPARKENDALAQRGGTPFTFTYEPLLCGQPLPPYKRPDSVRFTITKTEKGDMLIERSDYNMQSATARKMMKDIFQLTEGQSRKLTSRATPDILPDLLTMMQQLHDDLVSGRRHADSVPATAYSEIDKFLRQHEAAYFTPAEEIGPDGAEKANVANKANEPNGANGANGSTARPSLAPTGRVREGLSSKWSLTPADQQALQAMVADLRTQLNPVEWAHWVQPIAAADTVDCRTLLVTYYGSGYGRQNPRQAPAFLAALAALRRSFPDRIDDIRVTIA